VVPMPRASVSTATTANARPVAAIESRSEGPGPAFAWCSSRRTAKDVPDLSTGSGHPEWTWDEWRPRRGECPFETGTMFAIGRCASLRRTPPVRRVPARRAGVRAC
jgi:hypothetical protein